MLRPGMGRNSARLSLEQLEDRTLLSGTPANTVVPNDPQFSTQYALQNTGQNGGTPGADINAPAAWTVTTGSASVTVAVLDTGIDYDHPDLYDNIWLNQAEIPKSRLQNLVDIYHDGFISFRDLNNPINQGPGKVQDLNHDGRIDASDILAPMVLNAQGQDSGLGGWAYAGNTQDGDTAHPNDFIGWNFIANSNDPMDDNGHGTNVAGAIGAMGNNNEGIAGVAWNTSLMGLKFEDAHGVGTATQLLDALQYANQHGAKILNNSWGGVGNWPNLLNAIDAEQQADEIFVVAAGNGNTNIDQAPTYPVSFNVDNMVSVAATDNNGNLATFSNYGGRSVDLAAPGVNIVSTYPGKSYNQSTGTSMAAPEVAGVLALVWSEHPDWTYKQVIAQVMNTVTKVPSLQGKTISGGLVNAGAAVGSTGAVSPPPTPVSPPASPQPVVAPAPVVTGPPSIINSTLIGAANTIATLQVMFSKPVDPGSFTPDDVFFYNPNGQQIAAQSVTVVAGSNNTVFNIVFPTQTAAGAYSLKIGPEVFDAQWNKMIVFQTSLTIAPTAAPTPTSPPPIPSISSSPPSIISNSLIGVANTIATLQVTFSKPVDPGSFTPDDVFFYNPNGQQVAAQSVTMVAGSNHTVFNIVFPMQTAVGAYSLKIGPEVFDAQWNKMIVYQTTLTIGSTPAPAPIPSGPPSIINSSLIGTPNTITTFQVIFNKPVDPGSFKPSTVFFYNPSGQQIGALWVAPIGGSNNTTFNIVFPTQTARGTYSLKVGPEVFDAQWNKMIVFQTTFTIS